MWIFRGPKHQLMRGDLNSCLTWLRQPNLGPSILPLAPPWQMSRCSKTTILSPTTTLLMRLTRNHNLKDPLASIEVSLRKRSSRRTPRISGQSMKTSPWNARPSTGHRNPKPWLSPKAYHRPQPNRMIRRLAWAGWLRSTYQRRRRTSTHSTGCSQPPLPLTTVTP